MMKFTSYLSIGAFYSKNSSLNILKREKSFITQKQTPEVFCKNRCSYKFCKIHGKTPVLESFLKKLQNFRAATLLKRDSNTGAFLRNVPVKFAKFLKTPILKKSAIYCF